MHHPLSLSLSIGVALMGVIGHTSARPTAAPASPVYLRLSELPAALAADGHRPSASASQFPRRANTHGQGRLLWLTSTELTSPEVRALAADVLLLGDGVLVSRSGGDEAERDFFGFAGDSGTSIYRRANDGALEILVLGDAIAVEEATARASRWLDASSATDGTPKPASRVRADASEKLNDGSYTPSLMVRVDKPFADGRRIYHDIKIMRDVTASRDDKVVIVKTQVNQAPSRQGTWWNGEPNPGGKAYYLLIPDRYRVKTGINFSDDASRVTLEAYAPLSDGVKERVVNTSLSIKASSNVSGPLDVMQALSSAGAPAAGKLPVTLASGEERTETQSVTMTLKDYTTKATPESTAQSRSVLWEFPLAADIASDITYFQDGENHNAPLLSEKRATPMMTSATLETVSTWRLHGDLDGDLAVTTRSDLTTRFYDSTEQKSTLEDDEATAIEFTTRLPMGSPFLARQPVVRLQSMAGAGACLTQPDPARPDVTMTTCERGEAMPGQQWMLEFDGTYRNRASKQCLTADSDSGAVIMSSCDKPSLNKQWSWSADRIHSRFSGGNHWRLHVRGGQPHAMFDPALHEVIVSNDSHPLLRPWSSYPNKPTQGDVIPRLGTVSPPVPASYLTYREVSADERWQPVPIRQ